MFRSVNSLVVLKIRFRSVTKLHEDYKTDRISKVPCNIHNPINQANQYTTMSPKSCKGAMRRVDFGILLKEWIMRR